MLLRNKKGFTLAEIMIALTIIGVITAILLPVAQNSLPNEKVMKFKKANATLHRVINELVTSGEYYTPGDLGMKPNGSLIGFAENESNVSNEDVKYFCNTLADVLSIESVNCSNVKAGRITDEYISAARLDVDLNGDSTPSISKAKNDLDKMCKEHVLAGEEIITSDNIIYYQTSPFHTFGTRWNYENPDGTPKEEFSSSNLRLFNCKIPNGLYCFGETPFDRVYKILCMDIDGINQGEDPFGYGIRADGKIFTGARADEWLEKDIQDKE